MLELRYLYLPLRISGSTKLELGNLLKLEMLTHFSNDSSVPDLNRMTRLRSLCILINDEGWRMETLSSTLSKLGNLEDLTILSPVHFVPDAFLPKNKQPKLIYRQMLPDVEHFPSHLTTLYLKDCFLEEDLMPILETLQQLTLVSLWTNACVEKRMICSGDGFPQLRKLFISGLKEWEKWIVEEGTMPRLYSLSIYVIVTS